MLYDDVEKLFKMWYTNIHFSATERVPKKLVPTVPKEYPRGTCYAVSEDGFNWEKPSLGQVDFEGSKENNIVGADGWRSFKGGIFVDKNEHDPSKRFKALARITMEGE